MRGKLIVFEGVEGGGKTTQIQLCSQWLQASNLLTQLNTIQPQVSVVITKEPGGTSLGLGLRQLLLEEVSSNKPNNSKNPPIQERAELLLYAADRAQHVEEFIKPLLAEGAIILCDRYTDSTVAYQGYGRGLDLTLIDQLNQIATGGLESDLTIWLDVDVKIGLERAQKRGKTDRMEQASLAFHRRVQQGFESIYQQNPHRIVRVDASGSQAQVHCAIQEILHRHFNLSGYPSPSSPESSPE
ncbi:MAG: dTMP kinase [Symploca sp. SIO1C4]|uniref:Thymidylate kinase n=1 Tax=Symploca sp. SIO1C4 TaxID=2607765 RepID=A0A6B3NCV6_9CYAN|nr:dTMP kinase [Symploca sp. SIO1C4]